MSNQELYTLLKQLQSEIERNPSVDENEQALLRQLHGDIHKLLEKSSHENEQNPGLANFRKTIEEMEISHPVLTTTLSKIMEVLSNAGI
jgi:hypothetical protein